MGLEQATLGTVSAEGDITLTGAGGPGVRHDTKRLPTRATGLLVKSAGDVKIRDGRGNIRTLPFAASGAWALGVMHAIHVTQVYDAGTTVAAGAIWLGW